MCLAIPGKIVKINGYKAIVSYGCIEKEADCSLIKCKVNDYVIIQNGFIALKIPKSKAKRFLNTIK